MFKTGIAGGNATSSLNPIKSSFSCQNWASQGRHPRILFFVLPCLVLSGEIVLRGERSLWPCKFLYQGVN